MGPTGSAIASWSVSLAATSGAQGQKRRIPVDLLGNKQAPGRKRSAEFKIGKA
jgi:hypothetical protein